MDLVCLSPALTRDDVAKCGQKVLAVFDLYRIAFEERDVPGLDPFVAEDYKSYTSLAETDRESLKSHFLEMLDQSADIRIETHFAIEQGECAMVLHSFYVRSAGGSEDVIRTADCFRFWDGLIAEHWDAVMTGTSTLLI